MILFLVKVIDTSEEWGENSLGILKDTFYEK